jgi:hypothetical protein
VARLALIKRWVLLPLAVILLLVILQERLARNPVKRR